MRIRWTTRIAMLVGVITLIAGVAAGTGQASTRPGAAPASTSHVAAAR
jgi:hypothetical protein